MLMQAFLLFALAPVAVGLLAGCDPNPGGPSAPAATARPAAGARPGIEPSRKATTPLREVGKPVGAAPGRGEAGRLG